MESDPGHEWHETASTRKCCIREDLCNSWSGNQVTTNRLPSTLHHRVVVCAVNEDERLVLNRQLQTLPKPMEMADSPFRIRIIQKPVQWGELSQLGDDVNWLVVKDRKVAGQWVGSEEEKISQIRWQLISK